MWRQLSRKQMLGYKFRRQYGVDEYSIDFYCPRLKLAVEVDGTTHFRASSRENDEKRQKHIEQYGIRFLRFTNEEVYGDLSGVLETIARTILVMTKR
jgi:very-short-patch-repair endonuclease